MVNFIETKVRSERIQSDGTSKQIVDRYLVQADSFTEAEEIIVNSVDVDSIESVSRSNVRELFLGNGGSDVPLYKAKVEFVSYDEKTHKEKRKSHVVMVEAADIASAVERVKDGLFGTPDYEILSVAKSPIVDVFGL